MTAFLFGITLLVGFIAGFVVCLIIAQWAMDQSDANVFKDVGL
jgi:hypothetical protein